MTQFLGRKGQTQLGVIIIDNNVMEYFWHKVEEIAVCSCYSMFLRDQSRYAPNQWETSLQCNDVSHWLGAHLDWSLVSNMAQTKVQHKENINNTLDTLHLTLRVELWGAYCEYSRLPL